MNYNYIYETNQNLKKIISESLDKDYVREIESKYSGKWLDGIVSEANPSKHKEGTFDIAVRPDKKHSDLPNFIDADMMVGDFKKGQKVKFQIYVSPAGIYLDKVK